MILTDYYKAVQVAKSETRFDVNASTSSYDYYERLLLNKRGYNVGGLSFHFAKVPEPFNLRKKDKPDMAITKTENISSVFVPNVALPFGYGDNKNTNDAILIIFQQDKNGKIKSIELYVSRGQKHNQLNLYRLLVSGELDEEMEELRKRSKDKPLPNL